MASIEPLMVRVTLLPKFREWLTTNLSLAEMVTSLSILYELLLYDHITQPLLSTTRSSMV